MGHFYDQLYYQLIQRSQLPTAPRRGGGAGPQLRALDQRACECFSGSADLGRARTISIFQATSACRPRDRLGKRHAQRFFNIANTISTIIIIIINNSIPDIISITSSVINMSCSKSLLSQKRL